MIHTCSVRNTIKSGTLIICLYIFAYFFDFAEIFACAKKLRSQVPLCL